MKRKIKFSVLIIVVVLFFVIPYFFLSYILGNELAVDILKWGAMAQLFLFGIHLIFDSIIKKLNK